MWCKLLDRKESAFGIRRVIIRSVIALSAHNASSKAAAGFAQNFFPVSTSDSSQNAVSNGNTSSSTNSNNVSFQDFESAFSETLSAWSATGMPEHEEPLTHSGIVDGNSAVPSKNLTPPKSTALVQTADGPKTSKIHPEINGLLAGLNLHKDSEPAGAGQSSSSESAASLAATPSLSTAVTLGSSDSSTKPDSQTAETNLPAVTNSAIELYSQSTDTSKTRGVELHDSGSPSDTYSVQSTDDVTSGSRNSESDQSWQVSGNNPLPTGFAIEIVNKKDDTGAGRVTTDTPLAGKAATTGKTSSATRAAAQEKDVQAFSLVLSKSTPGASPDPSLPKIATPRQTDAPASSTNEKAPSNTNGQYAADQAGDESAKQDAKQQKQDQSTASEAAPISVSKSSTTSADKTSDPQTPSSPVAKPAPIETVEVVTAAVGTTNPVSQGLDSGLAATVKESRQTLQSSIEIQPKDLQESSNATPAKEILMKIQGQSGETISVRLVDQGGQVQIGVRSSDPNTAASLRQDLSSLTSNLERAGWKAEAATTVPETVLNTNNSKSSSDDSESSSNRNYPEWQEQPGRRKQTTADLWDETLDRQS